MAFVRTKEVCNIEIEEVNNEEKGIVKFVKLNVGKVIICILVKD